MWNAPHATYYIDPECFPAFLWNIEVDLPGVLVHAKQRDPETGRETGRWTRLKELGERYYRGEWDPDTLGTVRVYVPTNAAFLLEHQLGAYNIPYRVKTANGHERLFPWTDEHEETYIEYGRQLHADLLARGELLEPHPPTTYQLAGLYFSSTRSTTLNGWACGCLSGDTRLEVSFPGGVMSWVVTLRDLVEGIWPERLAPVTLRSVTKKGETVWNKLASAQRTGTKETWCVAADRWPEPIRATMDHKFLCASPERYGEWTPLSELRPGDEIFVEGYAHETRTRTAKILSIDTPKTEETYDLTMESPLNNYVANGFVVHNSGKTYGAILSILARPGSVLVMCPSKARRTWWDQVQLYTRLRPHRVLPESERRKGDQTLEAYLAECHAEQRRPFVVMGSEALLYYTDVAKMVNPKNLIVDEIHLFGNPQRWTLKGYDPNTNKPEFEARKTKNDNTSLAPLAMEICQRESINFRLGLTATPLDDGRPRRLWSQFDLLHGCKGAFGWSFRNTFAVRYCDGRPNENGYGHYDKGSTNLEELRQRARYFLHEVPYLRSHAELPPTRTQVVWLDPCDQNRSDRYDERHTFTQKLQALAKELKQGANPAQVRALMREVRIAEASSRKRNYIISETLQGLRQGGKVLIFTIRKAEAELWGHRIRQALAKGDEQLEAPVWVVHGESGTDRDRGDIVAAYAKSKGPCVLCATGHSIGTGVDGMQTTTLAFFAALPDRPGFYTQWRGRFDRHGGVATLLKIVFARGTVDEDAVNLMVEKFGPVEEFLIADEIKGVGDQLLGLDDREKILQDIWDLI